MKREQTPQERDRAIELPDEIVRPSPARADHEVVWFRGRLVPILGTVGGTLEQSLETARNIEAFFAALKSE